MQGWRGRKPEGILCLFLFPLVQYVRYRDYVKRDGQLMLGKTKAAAEAEARLRDRLGNVEAVRRASG